MISRTTRRFRSPLLALAAVLAAAVPTRAQEPALKGNDPVALAQGQQVQGLAELTVQRGLYTYRFATEANRAAFQRDPDRHEIQFGGGCGRMGPLSGAGDPDRWLVHDGRIYIFASDQCRDSFGKRAELFLDADDPAPKPGAEAAARGAELLARAVTAHGGADRLKAVRTYRHERSTTKGDTTETWRLQLALPGSYRSDHDYRQGEKQWLFANVVLPQEAFFLSSGKASDMHASGRREAMRTWLREPLVALRRALDGGHVVAAAGKATVADVAVEQFVLWIDGCATTFGLGADGRIRTASFRGRGPQLWFGQVALVFDDFAEVSGLILPKTVRGTFDGAPSKGLAEAREGIEVDTALPAESFTRPR